MSIWKIRVEQETYGKTKESWEVQLVLGAVVVERVQ